MLQLFVKLEVFSFAILLCILLCVLLTVLVAFGSFCFIKFIHTQAVPKN